MKALLYLLLIAEILWFSGCTECIEGKGHIVPEIRNIKSFTKIELKIPADVYIGTASKTTLQLHAQTNVADIITTKVKDDKLIIDASQCIGNAEPVNINIFTETLEKIEVEGSGIITTKHPLTVNKIEFEVEGSGKIFADVYANKVEAEVEGSGEIVINGTTASQEIEIEGSGKYLASGLRCYDAKVEVEGSGKAEISASNSLKATIEGSGLIIYAGNPKIKSNISGSGSIEKMK